MTYLGDFNSDTRNVPGHTPNLLAPLVGERLGRIFQLGFRVTMPHEVVQHDLLYGHTYLRRYVPISSVCPRMCPCIACSRSFFVVLDGRFSVVSSAYSLK